MQVYADNAATTGLGKAALERMLPYFTECYGNPSSLHAAGQRAKEAVEEAREEIAALLGFSAREVYFTSGGSEADNWAIFAAAEEGARRGKKHVISTQIEHHAVLHSLDKLQRRGFEVTLLPVSENGIVRTDDLRAALREDTALVTVMAANNEIGTLQPVEEMSRLCKERGVPFHTDGVQAVGHVPLCLEHAGALSLSAHKFGGPKGVGALCARKGFPLNVFVEGGAQERGKRGGTENVPAIVGMAAALAESVKKPAERAAYLKTLRDRLIDGLLKIPHSALNGDRTNRLPSNASFCFEGVEGESLLLLLNDRGICASSGSACTSGSLDPSHVLLAIGRPHEVAHGSLRLTLSHENTREEVDYVIKNTAEAVEYLRSISPVWQDLKEGKKQYVIQ